jgi:hypothetical protein
MFIGKKVIEMQRDPLGNYYSRTTKIYFLYVPIFVYTSVFIRKYPV